MTLNCCRCKLPLPEGRKHAYCTPCATEVHRRWYQANRERALSLSLAWNKRNPARVQAARDRYNAKRKEAPQCMSTKR